MAHILLPRTANNNQDNQAQAEKVAKMGESGKSFLVFLKSRRKDLWRIASKSCGEYTVNDVENEAWIIAEEIKDRRGHPVDFTKDDDQELLLSWLYKELVTFADKSIRYAVKIDKGWDLEESEQAFDTLANLLAAPENFDPLIYLQEEEDEPWVLQVTCHSYSQASAYAILLHRFDWDLESLADALRLAIYTVRGRIVSSGAHMHLQPSLFDRVQVVDYLFQPTVAKASCRVTSSESGQRQLEWEFT